MALILLPAVDVADGRAVRPTHGNQVDDTFDLDPLATARTWQADGAEWIHLVDLDAAFGRGSNAPLLASVIEEVDVPVELSGGIDDDATLARALASGCARIVLSTTAVDDIDWCARAIATHGDRIAIALDVQITQQPDGKLRHQLAARGTSGRGGDLWEALKKLDRAGCARYVVTDVSRDGMLNGPNIELYEAITSATAAAVITSGGVATLDDLDALTDLVASRPNLEGAIIGKALYAGRFTLPEALHASRAGHPGRATC